MGAEMRLALGVDSVKRLWRIETKLREGITKDVQVLADGGLNLWYTCNSHLEEIDIRRDKAVSENDREYLAKICHPDNPFSADPEEDVTYDKGTGKITVSEIETIRTIFHYQKRTNSRAKNSMKKSQFEEEKAHGETSTLMKTIIPSVLVKQPTEISNIADNMRSVLTVLKGEFELTAEEELAYESAMAKLRRD